MAVPKDHYVRVGPINVRYWVEGSGPPVVLIHGLGGSATGWLLSFDTFAARHRVYAPDILWHGKTGMPNTLRLELSDLVEFLCEFISILGIGPAHLVGHSMGGALTLRLALQYPERVRKLVLVDAGGLGREITPQFCLASIPALGEFMASRMYTPDVMKFGKNLRASSVHPDFITAELIENLHAVEESPSQYKSALKLIRLFMNALGQKKNFYETIVQKLPSLPHQTLVIWGRQDEILPLEHGELAAQKIPNSKLEVIEHCGHTPMFDQPRIFNRLVLEFLRN